MGNLRTRHSGATSDPLNMNWTVTIIQNCWKRSVTSRHLQSNLIFGAFKFPKLSVEKSNSHIQSTFLPSCMALQSLKGPWPPHTGGFLILFRHLVGLLGEWSAHRKSLCLYRSTQHRKTRTNIHALSGIRTWDLSVQAINALWPRCHLDRLSHLPTASAIKIFFRCTTKYRLRVVRNPEACFLHVVHWMPSQPVLVHVPWQYSHYSFTVRRRLWGKGGRAPLIFKLCTGWRLKEFLSSTDCQYGTSIITPGVEKIKRKSG
jgi:hypothetical protein